MHGIMFHHFYDDEHPQGQGAISADQFRKIIDFAGVNNILPAHEWLDRYESGKLRNNHLCLTFDDGLRCQLDVALPVLEEYELTGFWMIYSSIFLGKIEKLEIYRFFRTTYFKNVDLFYEDFFNEAQNTNLSNKIEEKLSCFNPSKYRKEYRFYTDNDRTFRYLRDHVLTDSEYDLIMYKIMDKHGADRNIIAQNLWVNKSNLTNLCSKGHIIGLHSHTHPTRIDLLSYEEQKTEYGKNHEVLSSIIKSPVRVMSHPCGRYNQITFRILQELNITLGFRANILKKSFSRFELPREDHMHVLNTIS